MALKRYWDSNAFIGWLGEERDKQTECMGVLKEAERGQALIVTSALTFAEVIKLRKHAPITETNAEKIREFFKRRYISVRNLDRYIADRARELIWKHNVDPWDAIHVATALQLKLGLLETFDKDLIKLDGRLGNPVLRIGRPSVTQQVLDLQSTESGGD